MDCSLRNYPIVFAVVIASKRVESAQLHPTQAEFPLSVAEEAADVGAHVRDAKYVELQHSDDGLTKLVPVGGVVAEPVSRLSTAAGEGRPAEHETPLPGESLHSSANRQTSS